jgi:nucleotide-binding universal stress UspA family protein
MALRGKGRKSANVMRGGSSKNPAGVLLCGVDDSDCGRAAARVAARLGRKLGLRTVLVHVAEVPALIGSGRAATATSVSELDDKKAEYLLAAIAVEEQLGPVERRVEFGVAGERLVRVAEEEEAALLVVGSRGRGAFKAALLGSVSSDAVAAAPCPVVVVPPGAADRA